jgi:hypothetical protein
MCVQNGPSDLKSPNMGMCTATETERDSQEQDKEGRRKLALNQLRPSQQLYKMVSNIC